MFSSRIPLKALADLSRRLATSLSAGVDIRRTLTREADNTRGSLRSRMEQLRDAANRGQSLTEALRTTGMYFPYLFRQLVEVGERTGHTAEVFAQLAENYEHQVQLRRNFIRSITGPMMQLCGAILVIGLLIWILGIIEKPGSKTDILGWGLTGTRGVLIYFSIVGTIAVAIWLTLRAAQRGALWFGPVQRLLLRVPVLGGALRTLALARFAWTFHVAMNAGMEIMQALKLSLESTNNAVYRAKIQPVLAVIRQGQPVYDALSHAGGFPPEFLDVVAVGEESGRLVESLEIAARQMQDQARGALVVLTKVAGIVVWMIVAGFIIAMIFKLAFFYLGMINDALKM